MLKWLVTKSPQSQTAEEFTTEDPLATIRTKRNRHEAIYSVSRVNPLFIEEGSSRQGNSVARTTKEAAINKISKTPPESPPTDHGSVRSSGYGSKEADSVSYQSDPQEEEDEIDSNATKVEHSSSAHSIINKASKLRRTSSPGTVAQLRKSFENLSTLSPEKNTPMVDILQQNSKYIKEIHVGSHQVLSLESIAEASNETEGADHYFKRNDWPRVSHLAQALQKQTEEISERREGYKFKNETFEDHDNYRQRNQNLRFNPLVSVVAQDGRYVTAISVSPGKPKDYQKEINAKGFAAIPCSITDTDTIIDIDTTTHDIPRYFSNATHTPSKEFPLLSLQMDSLVNEDTLRMMNLPGYESKINTLNEEQARLSNIPVKDIPDFGKAVFSGLTTSMKKHQMYKNKRPRSYPATARRSSRASHHRHTNKKGVWAMKDLWEKSGLKTNGRKLLVDINELVDEHQDNYQSMPSLVRVERTYRTPSISETSDFYCSIPTVHDSLGNTPWSSSTFNGIDNPAFVADRDLSYPSTSSKYVSSQFQYNLTDFQKRLSERMQGEPSNSHLNGFNGERDSVVIRPGMSSSRKVFRKGFPHPGKAVKEFGLAETDWRRTDLRRNETHEKTFRKSSNGEQGMGFGQRNRQQVWDTLYRHGKHKDSKNNYKHHPKGDAHLRRPLDMSHDFTMDAHKMQQMKKTSSKKYKRRRCCTCLVVLTAFISFIGVIFGISWYYTGGEKLFGSM